MLHQFLHHVKKIRIFKEKCVVKGGEFEVVKLEIQAVAENNSEETATVPINLFLFAKDEEVIEIINELEKE